MEARNKADSWKHSNYHIQSYDLPQEWKQYHKMQCMRLLQKQQETMRLKVDTKLTTLTLKDSVYTLAHMVAAGKVKLPCELEDLEDMWPSGNLA